MRFGRAEPCSTSQQFRCDSTNSTSASRPSRAGQSEVSGRSKAGQSLSLVAIGMDDYSLREIRNFTIATPIARIQAELRDYPVTQDKLMFSGQPDVCFVDFDRSPEAASSAVQVIHEALPQITILAVSQESEPHLILRAMRCGCKDYLLKPLDQRTLLQALGRVTRPQGDRPRPIAGQILSFVGVKGGCGVTTLAVNLAVALAKQHHSKTLLIDHHPAFGDASLYLSLQGNRYHFRDLLENTHRLDAPLVEGLVVRHPSGLDVLPSPEKFGADEEIYPEAVANAFKFLRSRYEFVLVDCRPGLGPANLAVIKHSDRLILVATREAPALQHATRYLDELGAARHPLDRVHVVINRDTNYKGRSVPEEPASLIGRSIDWKVPNDYSEVIKSINMGVPLSSAKEVTRSLSGWATLWAKGHQLGTSSGAKIATRNVRQLPSLWPQSVDAS